MQNLFADAVALIRWVIGDRPISLAFDEWAERSQARKWLGVSGFVWHEDLGWCRIWLGIVALTHPVNAQALKSALDSLQAAWGITNNFTVRAVHDGASVCVASMSSAALVDWAPAALLQEGDAAQQSESAYEEATELVDGVTDTDVTELLHNHLDPAEGVFGTTGFLPLQPHPKPPPHMRIVAGSLVCMSHSLDLSMGKAVDASPAVKTVFQTGIKLVNTVGSSGAFRQRFLADCPKALLSHVETRWASKEIVVNRILQLWQWAGPAMMAVRPRGKPPLLREDELEVWRLLAKRSVRILSGPILALKLASIDSGPSVHLGWWILQTLRQDFEETLQDDEKEDFWPLARVMLQRIQHHWRKYITVPEGGHYLADGYLAAAAAACPVNSACLRELGDLDLCLAEFQRAILNCHTAPKPPTQEELEAELPGYAPPPAAPQEGNGPVVVSKRRRLVPESDSEDDAEAAELLRQAEEHQAQEKAKRLKLKRRNKDKSAAHSALIKELERWSEFMRAGGVQEKDYTSRDARKHFYAEGKTDAMIQKLQLDYIRTRTVDYWMTDGRKNFSLLFDPVRELLLVPLSSASVERGFSTLSGHVKGNLSRRKGDSLQAKVLLAQNSELLRRAALLRGSKEGMEAHRLPLTFLLQHGGDDDE